MNVFFDLIDPSVQALVVQAQHRQSTALRPGTRANQRSVLAKFVRFVATCGEHFLQPSDEAVCLFFEKCLGTVKSPATVKNYTSILSTAYKQMGLDASVFHAFKVKSALNSIDKNVRHAPAPALPVSPALLKRVVRVVRRLPEGKSLAAAYVLMFHSFLRQSNFASATSTNFDVSRQIMRGDVSVRGNTVSICVKWSKSQQSARHQSTITLPAVPRSVLCPKEAVIDMIADVPTVHHEQPFLVFRDGSHIPAYYLRQVWNAVLKVLDIPQHHRYTLHGIRRGAATHVIRADPTARQDIKKHGMWRSQAVDVYLPSSSSKVFNVMRDTL